MPVRTRTAENRTKKWQAGDKKQRTEQNHPDKRHLQKAEPGAEASEREDPRQIEKEDNSKKNANGNLSQTGNHRSQQIHQSGSQEQQQGQHQEKIKRGKKTQ